MHPRDGKYGHAAVFPIMVSNKTYLKTFTLTLTLFKKGGCKTSEGTRQLPVCAIVCNFTKPTKDKPALLTHDEVRTLFHEFGHAVHHICAKANFTKFK